MVYHGDLTNTMVFHGEVVGGPIDTLPENNLVIEGEWWSEDGRIGLAHRRLSILDLSPLGRPPMHNK